MTIAEILLQIWYFFQEDISPVYVCTKGENVLLEFLGEPVSIKTKTGLYLKIPLFHKTKVVNTKKQIFDIHSHSFREENHNKKYLVPFNTSIDAMVEYRIVNPYVIYAVDKDSIKEYIENVIHTELNKEVSDDSKNIQNKLNKVFKEKEEEAQKLNSLSTFLSLIFLVSIPLLLWYIDLIPLLMTSIISLFIVLVLLNLFKTSVIKNKTNPHIPTDPTSIRSCIHIDNVVILSYDDLISHRTTI